MFVVTAFFESVLDVCLPVFDLFISKHDDLLIAANAKLTGAEGWRER